MTSTGLLFAAVGMVSCIGLVASIAKPAWFRFNGTVPRRWTIGATWLLLAGVCVLGTLAQRNVARIDPQATTPATSSDPASDMVIDMFPGQAVMADPPHPSVQTDGLMDAARPAEEPIDTLIDVAPPPPPSPPPPAPTRRTPGHRGGQ